MESALSGAIYEKSIQFQGDKINEKKTGKKNTK